MRLLVLHSRGNGVHAAVANAAHQTLCGNAAREWLRVEIRDSPTPDGISCKTCRRKVDALVHMQAQDGLAATDRNGLHYTEVPQSSRELLADIHLKIAQS